VEEELEAGEVVVKDEEDEDDEMAILNEFENAIKKTERPKMVARTVLEHQPSKLA
jgi:U4/U6.U5 tri-snRNP-associated protein 1